MDTFLWSELNEACSIIHHHLSICSYAQSYHAEKKNFSNVIIELYASYTFCYLSSYTDDILGPYTREKRIRLGGFCLPVKRNLSSTRVFLLLLSNVYHVINSENGNGCFSSKLNVLDLC